MSSTRDDNSSGGQQEDLKVYTEDGEAGKVKRWLREINLVRDSKEQRAFESMGRRICSKFKSGDDSERYTTSKRTAKVLINILWSNVKILLPVYFCRLPKPVVERMFSDSDPVGLLACTVAERCTYFQLKSQEHQIFYSVRAAVQDRLLPGRGTVTVSYDCEFEDAVDENGEPILGEDDETAERVKKPNSEKVVIKPLHWQRYFESHAENPFDVRWKAHEFFMTRAELITEFGKEIGEAVELSSYKDDTRRKHKNVDAQFLQQASVYYIEDLASKKRLWISEGYEDAPLREADSLNLKDFFSYPRPLLATTTTDSQYPTADYVIYMGLAEELDRITERLSAIVDCVRLVGVCAESLTADIQKMLNLPDGECQPIKAWAQFTKDHGGLAGVINWFPVDSALQAIPVLQGRQDDTLAKIDLVNGLPDIVRGSTDPNETLGAQQRKSRWVSVKVTDDQADVQRFCSDIISKIAELIFEPGLFDDETIALMCGYFQMKPEDQQMFPQALALLRDDRMRTFRVGIETDSTIALDEVEQQERWSNYMDTIAKVIGEIEQISQYRPEFTQPIMESALAAVRTLRTGRSVEGAWEKAMQQVRDNDKAKAEQAAQTPPPPDPAMMQIQLDQQRLQLDGQKAQVDMQKAQMEAQTKQMYDQVEMQRIQAQTQQIQMDSYLKQQELQQTGQLDAQKLALDAQRVQVEARKVESQAQVDSMGVMLEAKVADFQQNMDTQQLEIQKFKVALDEKDKMVQEARLGKQEQMDTIKMMHEHALAHKDAITRIAIAKISADKNLAPDEVRNLISSNDAQAPVVPTKTELALQAIHRHLSSPKTVTIQKMPDGTFQGTSQHQADALDYGSPVAQPPSPTEQMLSEIHQHLTAPKTVVIKKMPDGSYQGSTSHGGQS